MNTSEHCRNEHGGEEPQVEIDDTVRRDMKALKITEEWATDREKGKGLCKTCYPAQVRIYL